MKVSVLFPLLVLVWTTSVISENLSAKEIPSGTAHDKTKNPVIIFNYTCSISDDDVCRNITVDFNSIHYFGRSLLLNEPNFVHFNINLATPSYNATTDTFRPFHWVWTYSANNQRSPFLSWNIDFGLLSFGLLESKTIEVHNVYVHVPPECHIYYGTNETSNAISCALVDLIRGLAFDNYPKYENNEFCFLSEAPNIRETIGYMAALYITLPISFINYKCCSVNYFYEHSNFFQECSPNQIEKWVTCKLGPYILGLIIFMYFPIVLFEICGLLATDEKVALNEYTGLHIDNEETTDVTNDWLYLDGKSPLMFLDLLNNLACGLLQNHPVLTSRIRRLLVVMFAPIIIFIQIYMYSDGIGYTKIQVKDLVQHGTPMGFLSLLGEKEDRNKVFVPHFYGAVGVLIMYFTLGVLFLVCPRSLKEIVERGIPQGYCQTKTPICFSVENILELSMLNVGSPEPGYQKGAAVCKCSVYMVFSKLFWSRVWQIQTGRINWQLTGISKTLQVSKLIFLPLYIVFCFLEIIICVVYYGVPFIGFVVIMVKGATKSLASIKKGHVYISHPIIQCIEFLIVFPLFLHFAYSVCLIFIESFTFVSQIIIFCFISVIIYPSISFSYLFFFIVLVYHLMRLLRNFGDGYLELLAIAVERSVKMDEPLDNNVTIVNGIIDVTNLHVDHVTELQINSRHVDLSHNLLKTISAESVVSMYRKKDNMFGIPKKLFDHLVMKHRPVHQQVIKIVFQLTLIIILLAFTISVTKNYVTRTSDEISQVMHVIFFVTIGTLPHVLEIAMLNTNESVKKELESRAIEQSIYGYWSSLES